ncbi:killer cell lectin-like receptor subfamily B member 1B allele C isoform X1 [Mauremys reevesii]|uniref:killer cell lectin-like receptor subfamily B member 1B allele C isoform X1 n=1 Tax=Mauremys reevesii TaxID=260615 RepID=UPI00193F2EA3|nr:killer cell lectin-like receptor subfamily B member 1B allele C isoform X1 [Mauremys reevesii]
MAGEIIYADLKIPGASSSSRPPQPSQHLSSPPCPRWHRIAVGVGWAGNIVLTIAVIALGAWVSQLHISCEGQTRGTLNTSENNEAECSCQEDFRSHLKPHNGSLAEGSGCKLCPSYWLLHGDKCYWLSKERKNWTGSRDDCSGKSSRMLAIRNQEEMDFIRNVTKAVNHIWIGLNVTSPEKNWMWVDGSLVNQTLFPVTGLAEQNSCGVMKGEQIRSEICGAEFKWVCQKEAFQI